MLRRRVLATMTVAILAALLPAPSALAGSPARTAWFYKPPTDGSPPAAVAATTTGQMILTKRDESFRDLLRSAGYTAPILQYVEAAYIHGPSGVLRGSDPCDASFAPWGNNVAWNQGDFCRYAHPNEDWFLHNGKGERLINGYYTGSHGVSYAMNPASPGWRQFYASRVRRALFGNSSGGALGYDGIFLDDVWMTRHQLLNRVHNADGTVREFSSDADYRAAVIGLLQTVREAAAGRPVYANTDGNDFYLSYLDGTMREDFAASWNNGYMDASAIAGVWATVDRTADAGKSVILVAQGARGDLQRMRFSYAAYLMVAGPSVSFRYSRDSAGYRELWRYPEYALALGPPVRSRRLVGGSTWRRDFASGVALVNMSASAGSTVDLGGLYVTANGGLVSTIVLPPRSGTVLVRAGTEPEPFANVTPPTISGPTTVGSTLRASTGTWTRPPTSLKYSWLRCNAVGLSCSTISRATSSSYRLARRDAGTTIRVRVDARAGEAEAVSGQSGVIALRNARATASAQRGSGGTLVVR